MNKKYKYVIFSPYFGTLPQYFDLWLKSCEYNKGIKFIVFTDDVSMYECPDNVDIIRMSFNEFKDIIQSKFNFKISLDSPYKLCDYKPTYGYVFNEYLDDCEYWGHCDLDLIFGNILKFMPNQKFDKIAFLGHLSFYKNNEKNNKMFMFCSKKTINYVDILSNSQHFGFDEIGDYNINEIFKSNGLKIYNYEVNVADINCRKQNLTIITYIKEKFVGDNKNLIFVFDKGEITSKYYENHELNSREYAYVHLQKRKMENNVSDNSKYIITYSSFIDHFDLSEKEYKKLLYKGYDLKWIKFKLRALKNRTKRFLVIKKILKKKVY